MHYHCILNRNLFCENNLVHLKTFGELVFLSICN
uniref:Uncharacterized protein n=1 Tax=Siphoviridae sp. ctnFo11 TaxID=2826454 RepID=A0A8S5N5G1_9CAUD|nr:MAG TPA: hypothetical protein [Siphoviridae sp. ctnFo11]